MKKHYLCTMKSHAPRTTHEQRIADAIIPAMADRRMNLAELAEASGAAVHQLANTLTGRYALYSADIARLEQALGRKLIEVLEPEDLR